MSVDRTMNSKEYAGRLFRKKFMDGREPLLGDCSEGQLTAQGAEELRDLGADFATAYINTGFLSSRLDPSQVYVRSTNIDRTFESAINLMLGLYPLTDDVCTIADVLNIYTLDEETEDMYPPSTGQCPKLDAILAARAHQPDWVQRLNAMKPTAAYLETLWKLKDGSITDWTAFLDLFEARLYAGAPPLVGITQDIIDSVLNVSSYELHALADSVEAQRLIIGRFIGEILSNIKNKISGLITQKFYLLSGHDTTLGPVLSALQAFGPYGWPPYASHIVIELLSDVSGNYFVTVTYNSQKLVLPGCGQFICTLDNFTKLIQPVIPDNWNTECTQQ